MKFNWGTGILIFIIVFFIVIFSFIFFATNLNINLVEEDYYPKGVNYDAQWEKAYNTSILEEQISFSQAGDTLIIAFPAIVQGKHTGGNILFYRPSDNHLDVRYALKLDEEGRQYFYTGNLIHGKYIIKIDWILDSVPYYQEEVFFK